MKKTRKFQLADAMREATLVRFSSRFEDSVIRGYVLDIGPKFFLLLSVSDRIWFDGFEVFRKSDVRKLRLDPTAKFVEAALRKRREIVAKKPPVDISSISKLLISANRAFPLVTIHREKIKPDACWIGKILKVAGGRLSMQEINTDASWDPELYEYRASDITRVSFGGDYEQALYLVGGDPRARK